MILFHAFSSLLLHGKRYFWIRTCTLVLLLTAGGNSHAGVDEMLAAIKSVLAKDGFVAVLVVNMQGGLRDYFSPRSANLDTISKQASFLADLNQYRNVCFIDVNLRTVEDDPGGTLSALTRQMEFTARYSLWKGDPNRLEYVKKVFVSGDAELQTFLELDLKTLLLKQGIKTLAIIGAFFTSNLSRMASHALHDNFRVIMDEELMILTDNRPPPPHRSRLQYIERVRAEWEKLKDQYGDNLVITTTQHSAPCSN